MGVTRMTVHQNWEKVNMAHDIVYIPRYVWKICLWHAPPRVLRFTVHNLYSLWVPTHSKW